MPTNLAASVGAADDRWRLGTSVAQDNVHAVLMQLRREWSEDGAEERAQCFGSILSALEQRKPPLAKTLQTVAINVPGVEIKPEDLIPKGEFRVLIPGAGLGRC